jgi:XTP/dITP diphosphohydrolase
MQEIIVATANRDKRREIGEMLRQLPVRLSSLADYWDAVPAIPETGGTFLENALQKARWVSGEMSRRQSGAWILADDSGLEVDAIDGRPGVRSARFAGEPADVAANNRKLLELLARVPDGRRTARFKCAVALITVPDGQYFSAEGVCEGTIAFSASGEGGFGYDPLFVPDGFTKTFAELKPDEKHAISHRGRALEKVRDYCREHLR